MLKMCNKIEEKPQRKNKERIYASYELFSDICSQYNSTKLKQTAMNRSHFFKHVSMLRKQNKTNQRREYKTYGRSCGEL